MTSYTLRLLFALTLIAVVAACGGGGSSTTTAGGATETTTGGSTETTTGEPTETTTGGSGGESGSGEGSLSYTVTGSIEDSGEAAFVPSMSYFDSGFWTMTFGDPTGAFILVSLDPSTASVNYTNGGNTIGAAAECVFDTTSQDESGAAGSFECVDAPAVVNGALDTASISGEFSTG